MKERVLNEISNFCEECENRESCSEEQCILYRIEKIVEPELKEFEIEIEEVLQRVVKVKAVSEEDALDKIQDQYHKQEIILDAEDFKDCDIHLFNRGE